MILTFRFDVHDLFSFLVEHITVLKCFTEGFSASFTGRSHWNQEFCFIRKTTTGMKVTQHMPHMIRVLIYSTE